MDSAVRRGSLRSNLTLLRTVTHIISSRIAKLVRLICSDRKSRFPGPAPGAIAAATFRGDRDSAISKRGGEDSGSDSEFSGADAVGSEGV